MKPTKKKTAKILMILILIATLVGTLFAFVPMNFSNLSFKSILGDINTSTEFSSGVYAEYDISSDYSASQVDESVSIIKSVLAEEGYPNANVLAVNGKVEVELGCRDSEKLSASISLLNAVSIGTFELMPTAPSSIKDTDPVVRACDHLKSVEIKTYNDYIYVVLNFNEAGQKVYADLLTAAKGGSIYVCMGGETQTSFSASNATPGESMFLTINNYESAEEFVMRVKLGSIPVTLSKDTVNINIMEDTLSNGYYVGNISLTFFAAIIAVLVVILGCLVYMVIKFGVIGLFNILAVLIDSIITVVLMWAFSFVEIGLAGILALGLGNIILLVSSLIFAFRFEEEYNLGKTVMASLESAYKKSYKAILAINISLTVIFGAITAIAGAQIKVFGLITCVYAALSMFSTLVMLPGFIKMFEAFNDGNYKAYRLKAREGKTNEK